MSFLDRLFAKNTEKQRKKNQELIQSVEQGDLNTTRKLLKSKANINCTSKHSRTVLHIACKNNDKEMVQLLCESEPIPNFHLCDDKQRTPADLVSEKQEIVSLIRNSIFRSEKDLRKACTKGKISKVRKLLRSGVDINSFDNSGTPLHHACASGKKAAVTLLLHANPPADTNLLNKGGKTPLQVAIENGFQDIATLIREGDGTTQLIDRMLAIDQKEEEQKKKLLILGAGEAGKTTVVRRLQAKYTPKELTKKDVEQNRSVLQQNTIDSMQLLMSHINEDDLDADLQEARAHVLMLESEQKLTIDDAIQIQKLWDCDLVRRTFENPTDYYVPDSSEYYFDNVLRFVEEGFQSTEMDLVMARVRTSGVNSIHISLQSHHLEIVDVGGQRSERKKWLKFFSNIDLILFVINLAGYCKVCFEDNSQNRMHEAMSVFDEICSNKVFRNTPIYLFCNKKDLFESSLRIQGIDMCFPDYKGSNDMHESLDYIVDRFESFLPKGHKLAGHHVVSARHAKDIISSFEELTSHFIKTGKGR